LKNAAAYSASARITEENGFRGLETGRPKLMWSCSFSTLSRLSRFFPEKKYFTKPVKNGEDSSKI
jgi:hypothetical protein